MREGRRSSSPRSSRSPPEKERLVTFCVRIYYSQHCRAEQGIEYRVFNLDRLTNQDRASNKNSPSNTASNKERVLKENFKADASQCPDCMGTGFYYPEGTAKGVKRCEHRKLR